MSNKNKNSIGSFFEDLMLVITFENKEDNPFKAAWNLAIMWPIWVIAGTWKLTLGFLVICGLFGAYLNITFQDILFIYLMLSGGGAVVGFLGTLMKDGGPLAADKFNTKDFLIGMLTIYFVAAFPQFWFVAVILAIGRWMQKK